MTLSSDASQTTQIVGRESALARRLLGGAGAASLDAYRLTETLQCVAHGMTEDGVLVIAARPEGLLAQAVTADIRLDVVKQAPDPLISIVGCSLHLLGGLTWADGDLLADLPAAVADMLEFPGVRIGVIDIDRAVLHDLTGATPLPADELFYEPSLVDDEYAGYEIVASQGQGVLKDLCWAVMVGEVPGIVVSKAPLRAACSHTRGQVFCVDVDAGGVTLMLVGRDETLIVYAAYHGPAMSQRELIDGVWGVVGSAMFAA